MGRALEGTDRPLHKASEMDVVPEEDALLVEHHVAAELVTVFAENAGEVVRRGAQPEGVEERVADEAKEEVEELKRAYFLMAVLRVQGEKDADEASRVMLKMIDANYRREDAMARRMSVLEKRSESLEKV